MNVVDAWDKLDEALRHLEKTGGGRVARMNARRATLTSMRQLRAAIDVEYPVVRKKVRRRKTPLSADGWEARLERKGWVEHHFSGSQERAVLTSNLPYKIIHRVMWTPKWVAMAIIDGKTDSQMLKAKKSRREQKALNTLYVATKEGRGQ